MNFQPLTEQELDILDDFLLKRIPPNQWQEDKNEGVIDLSMLDGFFTAIASGPDPIQPSQWLPAMWGDFEPEWESEKQFEELFTLLVRYMNSVVTHLMYEPESFEPIFHYRDVDDEEHLIVDEWCEGYMLGVKLNFRAWRMDLTEIQDLLAPIIVFTLEHGEDRFERMDEKEVIDLQKKVTPHALALHQYWLEKRSTQESASSTFSYDEPRPSRNDPCPCGSGKKYKKCCLH